jgi:hypothetical protein
MPLFFCLFNSSLLLPPSLLVFLNFSAFFSPSASLALAHFPPRVAKSGGNTEFVSIFCFRQNIIRRET